MGMSRKIESVQRMAYMMVMTTLERTAKLNDVAREAGVSQGTVSNVFNRPELVREEVRERVREVAAKLGYKGPDPKGRLLRAGKVNAIGVAATEPLEYFFTDPFARVMMTGVAAACDEAGSGLSLISAASEEELAWNIRNALVDGLILFCLDGADRLVDLARERNLPFIANSLGLTDQTIPAIGVDNVGGARTAAEHLVGLGHRRFGILTMQLGDKTFGRRTMDDVMKTIFSASRDRVLGYGEALRAAGIDFDAVPMFETQADAASVDAAMTELFAATEPPTALLAESDKIALLAMEWLKAHKYAIRDDVSIIGFDGVVEAEAANLTTMAQPIAEIGRQSATVILERQKGPIRIVLPVQLVVRGTTAPPRH
jgi:DNA-binding LacI/PurR family transcriptional regulator